MSLLNLGDTGDGERTFALLMLGLSVVIFAVILWSERRD
jgi:hypothetical protein